MFLLPPRDLVAAIKCFTFVAYLGVQRDRSREFRFTKVRTNVCSFQVQYVNNGRLQYVNNDRYRNALNRDVGDLTTKDLNEGIGHVFLSKGPFGEYWIELPAKTSIIMSDRSNCIWVSIDSLQEFEPLSLEQGSFK